MERSLSRIPRYCKAKSHPSGCYQCGKRNTIFLAYSGFLIFQAWQILEETLSISRLSFILFEFLAGYTHFNCLLAFGKCPTKFERLLGTSSLGVIFSTNII